MPRHLAAAVVAALAAWPGAAFSQEHDAAQARTASVIVEGLAPGDLLNIRATASATGMRIGSVPNGAKLNRHGCSEVDGYVWCKVSDPEAPQLTGWAPGRYLLDFGPEPPAEAEASTGPASLGTVESHASGEIPCAREFGQPMTLCHADVRRRGKDEADVIVTWPAGGERLIRFREGKPESSDAASAELRVTREADLHMIRIGKAERFEIPNALALGR